MVHALEKIQRLLKPDGKLIDIHPTGAPVALEVRIRERIFPAGWIQETDDFVEYAWAADALASVVNSRRFTVEKQDLFTFCTYADSVNELREYLTEEWKDAVLDDITAMRAEELLSTIERDKEVIVRESIHIACFTKKQT